MPGLRAIPQGCAFHPRCPQAFARCEGTRPDPIPDGQGKVACWLYDPTEREAKAAERAALADEGVGAESNPAQGEGAS
jgi:peptide/nickel transport system ATP-binding protein